MSMFLPPFSGRLSRLQYWLGNLLLLVVFLVVAGLLVLALWALGVAPPDERSMGEKLIVTVFVVAVLVPWGILVLKRTRDLDFPLWTAFACLGAVGLDQILDVAGVRYLVGPPGWFAAVLLGLNIVWSVGVLGFVRGTTGPNRHGPDPLGPTI